MSETLETAPGANPLLRPWQTPFETPPFAEVKPEHFLPAFEQAFADHSAEIAAINHHSDGALRQAALEGCCRVL
jgi:peptidyl-dipeptidase Dcp